MTKVVSLFTRLKIIYFEIRPVSKVSRNFSSNRNNTTSNSDDCFTDNTLQEVMQKNKRKIKTLKLDNKIQGEILYGVHPVHLALITRKRKLYCLYVKERLYTKPVKQILEIASALNIKKELVTNYTLDTISGSRPHQGVCLDVSPLPLQKLDIKDTGFWQNLTTNQQFPIWLLPYRVQDTMNLGGILRTSYYLGIDQVILPEKQSAALSGSVSKASSGALEVIEIKTFKNHTEFLQFIQAWKEHGGQVIGTIGDSDHIKVVPVNSYIVNAPVLVIVGNEEQGVKDDILEMCDTNVTVNTLVELHPLIDSLNVSVATGIILHTLISNRQKHIMER